MIDTNNTQTATHGKCFPEPALKAVETRKKQVGVGVFAQFYAICSVTENLKTIADEVVLLLSASGAAGFSLTGSDIEKALVTLIKLRVMQVQNVRMPEQSRYVWVPDFFAPFLAALGRYEDPLRSLTIYPTWSDGEPSEDTEGSAVSTGLVSKEDYDSARVVVRTLQRYGVRCSEGLPAILTVESDSIYRVREDETGNLCVAGPEVDDVTLLVRSVIRVQFLRRIFGDPRTRYIGVEELRGAAEAVAALVEA